MKIRQIKHKWHFRHYTVCSLFKPSMGEWREHLRQLSGVLE